MAVGFYLVLTVVTVIFTDIGTLEGKAASLIIGALLSGCVSPAMVFIVCRLQIAYES